MDPACFAMKMRAALQQHEHCRDHVLACGHGHLLLALRKCESLLCLEDAPHLTLCRVNSALALPGSLASLSMTGPPQTPRTASLHSLEPIDSWTTDEDF